ncbi:MAG: SlyX family protein [Salinisphaeraceae bacterium]|nr:SlyX family protein [Salinisphaeraceae bacterium]
MKLEDRVEELEAKLAFAEDTLQALNDVIARQDAEIVKLQRELRGHAERLKGLASALEADSVNTAVDEKPPHY